MNLKNQAEFNGIAACSKLQIFTNICQVEIQDNLEIKIIEKIDCPVLCCSLRIFIEIENQMKNDIEDIILLNKLPCGIDIRSCSIKVNGKRHQYLFKDSQLRIKINQVKAQEKCLVELVINRKNGYCNNWCSFDNLTILLADNQKIISNKVRIFNGFKYCGDDKNG